MDISQLRPPKTPSVPPGKTAAALGTTGGLGITGLLVWAVMSMQSESEAVRAKLDTMVEKQTEIVVSQTRTAEQLAAYVTAAEKEAQRAREERQRLEARVQALESRRRKR